MTPHCPGRRISASFFALPVCAALLISASPAASAPVLDPLHPIIGTLESQPEHALLTNDAGAPAVVVSISWDQDEKAQSQFDAAYLQGIKQKIARFRQAGKLIVLDLGMQYPPTWIFHSPSAHFVNQYGDSFDPQPGSGDCGVNLVFSQEMRDRYREYVHHIFDGLGSDYAAVRLGGGRYGELGYPASTYHGHTNCYWAFDSAAQGRAGDLPAGVQASPVPGWLPGQPSPGHESARTFLNWYMESMKNYHDWQIATLREFYSGPLFMLYPSTGGLRPGQLDAAINDDANGSTGPEKTGEVGRGFDMARFVAGIRDPGVVVYSTWIDGFFGSDDASPNPARWSPGHFLASLAAAHQPPLLVGGENTGSPDDLANMQLTFQRLHDEHLCVLFWAFERTLFDHRDNHATLQDFKNLISTSSASPP
jgi:hypothetical protein